MSRMKRFSLIFLLLISHQAFAAWTFNAVGSANNATANDQTINSSDGTTMPAHSTGDILLACWSSNVIDDNILQSTTVTGWTLLKSQSDLDTVVHTTSLWGKVAASGSETVPDFSLQSAPSSGSVQLVQIASFSGGTLTIHASDGDEAANNSGDIDHPALTVSEDNTLIIVCGGHNSPWASVNTLATDALAWAELGEAADTSADDVALVWDYLIQTTAASISAGTFDVQTPASTSREATSVIVSLSAAGASPPTFDSNPTLSSCDDTGCTFDYDADAVADAIYAMFTDTAAAAPTCAQIEAETGSHGANTEATTGSSDSITITSSDTPEFPLYDAHFCLEEGTSNYSSVVTVSDNTLSDPTGEQFVAITSVAATSLCDDFNTAVDPDIANGDYLLSPDATSPGSFALTWEADCDASYSGDDSRQLASNINVYDASAGDWHVSDIDAVFNNSVPVPDEDQSFAFDIDVAFSDFNVCTTYFSDDDGDTLTGSVDSGILPNGLSLGGTNNCVVSGDPDTENESGVAITFGVDDGFGGTAQIIITFYPVDSVTMPTITDSDIDAAITDELTSFPWRADPTLTVTFKCDNSEAENEVLTQSPAPTTEVAYDQVFTLTVSYPKTCAGHRRRLH